MAQDQQIVVAGTAAVPLAYTVPNSVEVEPKAVNASFDGSGAASAFVPTLEIVSDGGVVIARVPVSTTVAAGGSADVTFAPFLGRSIPFTPGGTFAPGAFLYDFTLTADAVSIDTGLDGPFAGALSTAYYLLELWLYVRTDEATTGSSISMTVNNDGSAIYDRVFLSGFSNLASPGGTTNVTVQNATTSWTPAAVCGAAATAGYYSVVRASFPSYAQAVGFKVGEAVHAHPNAVAGINPVGMLIAPQTLAYRSTNAITRFKVTPATGGVLLKAGSRLLVYGR